MHIIKFATLLAAILVNTFAHAETVVVRAKRVPQVTSVESVGMVGRSNDLWQTAPGIDPVNDGPNFGECHWLPRTHFIVVPEATRSKAIALLVREPFIELDRQTGAYLLGLPRADVEQRGLAATAFANTIERMEISRASVLATHIGSWSLANQIDLDELKASAAVSRVGRFKAYLVRGLAGHLPGDFVMQRCRSVLRVSNGSYGQMPSKPERSAVVVFLDKQPTSVFVMWDVVIPHEYTRVIFSR